MSTIPQEPYSTVDDLEATADYPPAAAAAPADTWVIAPRPQAVGAEEPLRAYHEEIRTLRQSVAGMTVVRDQLHSELSALSAKRHELEELLLTRDALLSKHERELSARQDEIGSLRESLAAASTAREQLQAEHGTLAQKLQELEQAAAEGATPQPEHDRQLAERDQRLEEMTEQLSARAQQHFLAAAERDDLQARLERAKADLSSLAQRRDRQTSAQADSELARRTAALARSHDEMTELQRRVSGHREALQRAEARRQVFEAMLREREDMLDARDARLRALQDELESQRREHRSALESANSQLAAAIARANVPDREFGQPFEETSTRESETVPAALTPADADPQAPQRIAALEFQLADLRDAMHALQEQLRDEQAANEGLLEDLAAAEQQLREAAGDSRLHPARPAPLQADADAGAPPASKGQRLLVRTEGDAGIVHVLGRRTTIGRIPANDLCIDADLISRHHAVVLVADANTVVEDLNSTNGVFVNGVRIARHELHEGDVLTIGKVDFRYVFKPQIDQH